MQWRGCSTTINEGEAAAGPQAQLPQSWLCPIWQRLAAPRRCLRTDLNALRHLPLAWKATRVIFLPITASHGPLPDAVKHVGRPASHEKSFAWLQGQLVTPFDGRTVVVTRHGVAPASVHPRYRDDPVNAGFVSDLRHILNLGYRRP